jgi:hypothetical protein
MYPHSNRSGRSGLYRPERDEEYMRSRYAEIQDLPHSGYQESARGPTSSGDQFYRPYRMDPPADYREQMRREVCTIDLSWLRPFFMSDEFISYVNYSYFKMPQACLDCGKTNNFFFLF